MGVLSNGDIFIHLDEPVTRFSRSRYIWSRISQKRCFLGTKLLQNTNRKPYQIYQIVPLLLTLIGHWLWFQGRVIFRTWQTDRQTDGRTDGHRATSNTAITPGVAQWRYGSKI